MATLLIATTSGGVVHQLDLDPGQAYSLGRSNRCDIPLAPRSVSRRHALLFPHASSWWVADAGSSRGLTTAEGPTRFAQLTLDRWVSIGPLVLWLLPGRKRGGRSQQASAEAAERDPFLLSETDGGGVSEDGDDPCGISGEHRPQLPSLLELQVAAVATTGPAMRAASDSTANGVAPIVSRFIDLSAISFATIGSDVACTLRVSGDAVAPLHAVLVREPSRWALIAAQGVIESEGSRFLRKRLETGEFVGLSGLRLRTVEVERPLPLPSADTAERGEGGADHADSWAFRRSESAA